jgi:hypothetical protein
MRGLDKQRGVKTGGKIVAVSIVLEMVFEMMQILGDQASYVEFS